MLEVKTVGVRFDIGRIESAAYGNECWKVFWQEVEPTELKTAVLYEGDTAATLGGRENVFCIAVQRRDPGLLARLRDALSQSEAFSRTAASPPFVDGAQAWECLANAGRIEADGTLSGRDAFTARSALGTVRLKRRGAFQLPAGAAPRRRPKPASRRTANLPPLGSFEELVGYSGGLLSTQLKGPWTPGELCDVAERYAGLLTARVNEYAAAVSESIAQVSFYPAGGGSGGVEFIGMYAYGSAEDALEECRSRLGDMGRDKLLEFAREQGIEGRWQMTFERRGSGVGGIDIPPALLWAWLRGRGEVVGYPFPLEADAPAPAEAPPPAAEDRVRFRCRGCRVVLKATPRSAGKKGKCPRCGADYVVPHPQEG